jgi:hypothetical protein
MKFDDSLAESLHVALRKGCDSSASSAAWNLIYLLKPKQWNGFLKHVEKGFEAFSVTVTGETKKLTERALDEALAKQLKKVVTKWEPYGEGHEAVALHCVFDLFSENDWHGFASFLSYSIEKEKEAKRIGDVSHVQQRGRTGNRDCD